MTEGPALTYEQPLRPGEARLDVGRESVAIAWRLPSGAIWKDIFVYSLVIIPITGWFVWNFRWGRGREDLFGICALGILGVFVLDAMLKEIRSAHHPWVISANRERLARASSASRIEEMTPMFFVREFAVEVRPEGHVLLANGGSDAAATIPWYQFRRRAQHLSLPARLLTHADPEFVARAANALNALLTEPPTPSFPPPPSPDPPS